MVGRGFVALMLRYLPAHNKKTDFDFRHELLKVLLEETLIQTETACPKTWSSSWVTEKVGDIFFHSIHAGVLSKTFLLCCYV